MAEASRYRRIVVKAGTTLLTGGKDRLDLEVMASLVGQAARLHQQGVQVAVVTSGAVAAGRHLLNSARGDRDIAARQVLAAVGQGRLMGAYEQLFGQQGITVAQALITRRDTMDRIGYLNIRNTLLALLERQVVPIINENDVVAVEELGEGAVFGDNDRLSALVANLVDADLLLLLGDIPGLYSADPHLDPDARLIPRVERVDAAIEAMARGPLNVESRGGMATKVEAAKLATASGVAVVIADGRAPEVVLRLAAGEPLGTFFPPTSSKLESRQRWMLSSLSRGELQIDAGAVEALKTKGGSLLPAGVRGVQGVFQRGDVVAIVDPQGQRVACGIANYRAEEVEALKGARSDRIRALLGAYYGDEVVHRDNLVVL